MSPHGILMRLLIGENRPEPAPREVMEAFLSAEVATSDEEPTRFQLTFGVGRSGASDLADYELLRNLKLNAFNRLILAITFASREEVLVDGFITDQQLNPGNEPGTSTMSVTGEDVSVMMNVHQQAYNYPDRRSYKEIVREVLGRYSDLFPDRLQDLQETQEAPRNQKQGTEHQPANFTDWRYLQDLTRRMGFVFYITPGPEVESNGVYWGPPKRERLRQDPLSDNMGPSTNLEAIDFRSNALAATRVVFRTGENADEETLDAPSAGRTPLASSHADLRRTVFFQTRRLTPEVARVRAQAIVDRSLEDAVTATGTLSAVRYGALLKPRGVAELRGVGGAYSGDYYVKRVDHAIRRGEYKQHFTLTREGSGARSQQVQK